MSSKAHIFYALVCDFPRCGDLFDNDEYTYTDAGVHDDAAREEGWIIDWQEGDKRLDYCPSHVVEPESEDPDDENYGRRPLEDTWSNRVKVEIDRSLDRANAAFDRLLGALEPRAVVNWNSRFSAFNKRFDREFNEIHERACRAIEPDLPRWELNEIRKAVKPL